MIAFDVGMTSVFLYFKFSSELYFVCHLLQKLAEPLKKSSHLKLISSSFYEM